MIEDRMTLRITEAELARDIHAVLARVQEGVEIVVEQDHRPVAVIKSPMVKGRKISEVIAALEASVANAVIDEDFARDVEEGVNAHREPWNPPSWE
jgi:antitoxin (DNA-binding transcriptional repressor) of toxin-antitoxin stability system